jgi:hypothetical protein
VSFFLVVFLDILGTALKILFSSNTKTGEFELKRNEVISLINSLGKYSTTLKIIDKFFERRLKNHRSKYIGVSFSCVFLLIALLLFHEIYKAIPKKIKKMFAKAGSR